MDVYCRGPGLRNGLHPGFEYKVLEDRGDHWLLQQADGVVVIKKKFMSSIPHHERHLLVDRESWKKHYKPRLDPATPTRYPQDWQEALKQWNDPRRDYPLAVGCDGLFGRLRDWMGMENIALVVYDDPAWFEEMVTTLADCTMGVLQCAFERGAHFDCANFWEDMCYSGGPLLSPQHFKQYLLPHYRRITDLLKKHGIDVVWLDCDGKIDALLPLWLQGGVNCMFPVEVGTWGADPIKYRKEYGKDLLMMGGFDKHILARSKQEIEKEIHRLTPLMEEGGFIGFCDHRVPPDVPLENYVFYLETVRRVWGKGTNLKPIGELERVKQ
jgi:uroporphyrinogen decarboxylase